jgi:molybdopterin/thiamine biosynthesis adenylyltransferase
MSGCERVSQSFVEGNSGGLMQIGFDYQIAFSRNLGWVTEEEQARLRRARIAIAGLGGVGGIHLLTLARLGVEKFNLAEYDTFDLANFNRQCGATMSTLERPKLDVMIEMARGINPSISIRDFPTGVEKDNVDAFLEEVDLFVDGLDFFAFSARELVFGACAAKNIPATTVAPLGMGAALLNFVPGGMSFADYFGFHDCAENEKPLRFLLGLAPAALHRRYLVDPSFVDLVNGRGPSTAMACQICSGVAATEALKILLARGRVLSAPHGVHFDAFRNKLVRTWRPGGYRNPLQRAVRRLARRQLNRPRVAQMR